MCCGSVEVTDYLFVYMQHLSCYTSEVSYWNNMHFVFAVNISISVTLNFCRGLNA